MAFEMNEVQRILQVSLTRKENGESRGYKNAAASHQKRETCHRTPSNNSAHGKAHYTTFLQGTLDSKCAKEPKVNWLNNITHYMDWNGVRGHLIEARQQTTELNGEESQRMYDIHTHTHIYIYIYI